MAADTERRHGPTHPLDRQALAWWREHFGGGHRFIRDPYRATKRHTLRRGPGDGRYLVHGWRRDGSGRLRWAQPERLTTLAHRHGWRPTGDMAAFVKTRIYPRESFSDHALIRIDIARQAFNAKTGPRLVAQAKTDAQRDYVRLARAVLAAVPLKALRFDGFTLSEHVVQEITGWTRGSAGACIGWLREQEIFSKVGHVPTPRTFVVVEDTEVIRPANLYVCNCPLVFWLDADGDDGEAQISASYSLSSHPKATKVPPTAFITPSLHLKLVGAPAQAMRAAELLQIETQPVQRASEACARKVPAEVLSLLDRLRRNVALRRAA